MAQRSLWGTALKTAKAAAMTGNLGGSLMAGAMDAADVLYEQYGNIKESTGALPMKIKSVSIPNAKGSVMKGTLHGAWSGATAIKAINDGLVITQRVLMGTVKSDTVTGYGYLWDQTDTDKSYIGDNNLGSDVVTTYAAWPILGGGQIVTGIDSDTLKENFLYPTNSLVTKVASTFEFWKPLKYTLNYVPLCPTTTRGNLLMSWTPSDISDFGGTTTGYYPAGSCNSFINMTNSPYFVSTPVWKSATLSSVEPMKHGCAAVWLRTHLNTTQTSTSTSFAVDPNISAGCFVFNLKDNDAGVSVPSNEYGYIFAEYTHVYKGQHNLFVSSYGYGSSLPLSVQEKNFKAYIDKRRKRLLANKTSNRAIKNLLWEPETEIELEIIPEMKRSLRISTQPK